MLHDAACRQTTQARQGGEPGPQLRRDEEVEVPADLLARRPVLREQLRRRSGALASMFEWFEDVGFGVDIDALRRDFPQVGWHDYSAWAREQGPAAFC